MEVWVWLFVINNCQSTHKQAISLSRITFFLSFLLFLFITYKANKELFSSKNTALVFMVSWQVERYYAYICCHKFLVNARYDHLCIKTNTKRKCIRNWGANSLSIQYVYMFSKCPQNPLKKPLSIGLSVYFPNFTISVLSSFLVIDLERRRCLTKRERIRITFLDSQYSL